MDLYQKGDTISIHASLREATQSSSNALHIARFQFTPLYERLHNGLLICVSSLISIHASLREATRKEENILMFLLFQFTPLYEGLPGGISEFSHYSHFNSRLSTRGYDIANMHVRSDVNFNSRLSTRGYVAAVEALALIEEFQFTPLYERLRLAFVSKAVKSISIHASLREATAKTANIQLYFSLIFVQLVYFIIFIPLFSN